MWARMVSIRLSIAIDSSEAWSAEIRVETGTSRYWTHLEEYPMHLSCILPTARSEFLSTMAFGVTGQFGSESPHVQLRTTD